MAGPFSSWDEGCIQQGCVKQKKKERKRLLSLEVYCSPNCFVLHANSIAKASAASVFGKVLPVTPTGEHNNSPNDNENNETD
jgi:hypothetical protein